MRNQSYKIFDAAIEPFPNFGFGNIVAPVLYARPDPTKMKLGTIQPDAPNHNAVPMHSGPAYQQWDSIAAQGRFEYMIPALLNGGLQHVPACPPSQTVGIGLIQRRIIYAQNLRPFVRIEIIAAVLAQELTDDAAFTGAVRSCNDRQHRAAITHRD